MVVIHDHLFGLRSAVEKKEEGGLKAAFGVGWALLSLSHTAPKSDDLQATSNGLQPSSVLAPRS